MIEIAAQYSFGEEGSARPFMREGWSHRERDFTWTEGTSSRIVLPYEAGSGQVVLEISLNPLLHQPMLRRQRLVISVNGHDIGDETLTGECTLSLHVPAHALADAACMDVQLQCPTAVVPAVLAVSPDDRQLGVAVHELLVFRTALRPPFTPRYRAPLPLPVPGGGWENAVRGLTGLDIPDLATRFESIGHNCEFGLVQRSMGAEVLGLLRFGGIAVRRLIEGLDLGFEGLEAPGNLLTYIADASIDGDPTLREFIVRDRRYGTNFHTDMYEGRTDAATVVQIFERHFAFLRRRFVEDLASGQKIFVFQHPAARSVVQVRAILNLLRSHGPNALLFVTDDGSLPTGAVEQIEEDLFHGVLARLAPAQDVLRFDLASWVSVCANAYRLWRESGRGEV